MSSFKSFHAKGDHNTLLTEAFNSEPYDVEMLKKGASDILFNFTASDGAEYQIRFRNAPKLGTNVRRVTVRQKKGSTYKDVFTKMGDGMRVMATMIHAVELFAMTPLGKATDGMALDMSKKAAPRASKIFKKALSRNKKFKRFFKVVDTVAVSDEGVSTAWAVAKAKNPTDVFNGPDAEGLLPSDQSDVTDLERVRHNLSKPTSQSVAMEKLSKVKIMSSGRIKSLEQLILGNESIASEFVDVTISNGIARYQMGDVVLLSTDGQGVNVLRNGKRIATSKVADIDAITVKSLMKTKPDAVEVSTPIEKKLGKGELNKLLNKYGASVGGDGKEGFIKVDGKSVAMYYVQHSGKTEVGAYSDYSVFNKSKVNIEYLTIRQLEHFIVMGIWWASLLDVAWAKEQFIGKLGLNQWGKTFVISDVSEVNSYTGRSLLMSGNGEQMGNSREFMEKIDKEYWERFAKVFLSKKVDVAKRKSDMEAAEKAEQKKVDAFLKKYQHLEDLYGESLNLTFNAMVRDGKARGWIGIDIKGTPEDAEKKLRTILRKHLVGNVNRINKMQGDDSDYYGDWGAAEAHIDLTMMVVESTSKSFKHFMQTK